MRGLKAFTLIELLVVVSIVALLASILFPVFAHAKEAAKTTTCLSNLRQIGQATAIYGFDAEDRLPFAASSDNKHEEVSPLSPRYGLPYDALVPLAPDVRTSLAPYDKSDAVWVCPLDQIDDNLRMEGGHAATWREEVGASYAYDDVHGLIGFSASGFPSPSDAILFVDLGAVHPHQIGLNAGFQADFADGHAKRIDNRQRIKDFAPLSTFAEAP